MKALPRINRWFPSLLGLLKEGRQRAARQRSHSPVRQGIERLEVRDLLSATVQFDASSVFNADVVVNRINGVNDTTQTPIDLIGTNWSLVTQSAANALVPSGGTANGLPDNGFFFPNSFHPDVQLATKNASNGNNARRAGTDNVVASPASFGFTLGVPQNNY
ncbi:MAG: hypothetical protein ACKV0T_30775 [Planctomycetales bacterium]